MRTLLIAGLAALMLAVSANAAVILDDVYTFPRVWGGDCTAVQDNDVFYTGTASGKITALPGKGYFAAQAALTTTVEAESLDPVQTVLSFWYKYSNETGADATLTVHLQANGDWGPSVLRGNVTIVADNTWRQATLDFTGWNVQPVEGAVINRLQMNQYNSYRLDQNFNFDQVTLVPEPMTLSVLGLGGLALIRRRRA